MPMVRGLDELTEFQGEVDLALMPSEVMQCKKHFDTLVITPIDIRQVLPTLAHMVTCVLQREIHCCL